MVARCFTGDIVTSMDCARILANSDPVVEKSADESVGIQGILVENASTRVRVTPYPVQAPEPPQARAAHHRAP